MHRGGDTRGAGGALAPPLFMLHAASFAQFAIRRDPASHAHPKQIELRMRFFAPPIAFPTHVCTRALIMAKRQASLAELCGPRKKGRDSSETDSDVASPDRLRLGHNSSTAEPSSSSTPTASLPGLETDREESDEGEITVSTAQPYVAQAVTKLISQLTSKFSLS